jgi:hypothetical protein
MGYNLCHGTSELANVVESRLIGSIFFHPYG